MSITALASVLVSPAPASRKANSVILAGTQTDPAVLATITASCQNCHSANTLWPWYSRVAPLSWLIERDVHAARAHMDLSRWSTYGTSEKMRLLAGMGSAVRNGVMPPKRYLLLHPEAKLSPDQIGGIYRWTRTVRKQLRESGAH